MNKNFLLSHLRSKIAEQVTSAEEAQEIIQELQRTDWTMYSDTLLRSSCHNSICGAFVLPEEMRENTQIVRHHRRYCIHCEEIVLNSYTYPCDNCGLFYKRMNNGRTETCGECVSHNIIQQVEANLTRASSKKLLATLTIYQWMENRRYFDNRCAYCGKESDLVLDHYIPVTRGGGTTQDNCIPSCLPCNTRKGNKSPDGLLRYFPRENVRNIESYLAKIRQRPQRSHAFKKGDWVTCSIIGHRFYGAIGTVERIHEYLDGYDICYSSDSPRHDELFPTRWHRPYAFLKEEELQISKPTESHQELIRIQMKYDLLNTRK